MRRIFIKKDQHASIMRVGLAFAKALNCRDWGDVHYPYKSVLTTIHPVGTGWLLPNGMKFTIFLFSRFYSYFSFYDILCY